MAKWSELQKLPKAKREAAVTSARLMPADPPKSRVGGGWPSHQPFKKPKSKSTE